MFDNLPAVGFSKDRKSICSNEISDTVRKKYQPCNAIRLYFKHEMSRDMTKPTRLSLRLAKTQISLGIRPVWSESSLCAQWVAKDPSFLHADKEDSDQTGRMPRLIWVFAVRTVISLVLSCRVSNSNALMQYNSNAGNNGFKALQITKGWTRFYRVCEKQIVIK